MDGSESPETKKADVMEHPEVSHHVGLLNNSPPSRDLFVTDRVAFYLVIRFIERGGLPSIDVPHLRLRSLYQAIPKWILQRSARIMEHCGIFQAAFRFVERKPIVYAVTSERDMSTGLHCLVS